MLCRALQCKNAIIFSNLMSLKELLKTIRKIFFSDWKHERTASQSRAKAKVDCCHLKTTLVVKMSVGNAKTVLYTKRLKIHQKKPYCPTPFMAI